MSGLKIPFTGLQKQYNNLRAEVLDTVDIVLRSGQLMDGNYTQEFESWLAHKNHVQHAVTVHSGTNALEAIAGYYYRIFNLNRPKVIIPNLTFRATANAWLRSGWDIVVADTDQFGMLDIQSVEKYHYDTLVVCLVGLHGNSLKDFQTQKFMDLVAEHNWIIVEDAAQHWLSWDSKRIGPSAISFDPMKNLGNYGNGGAIVTNEESIYEYAQNFKAHGKTGKPFGIGGSNSRMSEVDCATMLIKTKYIDEWQERRQEIGLYWMERLRESPVRSLIDSSNSTEHCFHKFVIEVDNRDSVRNCLTEADIETKIHYEHGISELYECAGIKPMLSASTSLSRRTLSLPIYPELTDLEVDYTIDQVLRCVS